MQIVNSWTLVIRHLPVATCFRICPMALLIKHGSLCVRQTYNTSYKTLQTVSTSSIATLDDFLSEATDVQN